MCQRASHADMHVTASAKYVAQSTTGMIKSEKEEGRPVTVNRQGSARHMNMTSASGQESMLFVGGWRTIISWLLELGFAGLRQAQGHAWARVRSFFVRDCENMQV